VRDLAPGFILNDHAVAGRTWIASGSAVAVGDEVVFGRTFAERVSTLGKKRFSGRAGIGHVEVYNLRIF